MDDIIKKFLFWGSPIERMTSQGLNYRWPTFKIAMNLLVQGPKRIVVETGCMSEMGWASGNGTMLFGSLAEEFGITVHTVDNDEAKLDRCKLLTRSFSQHINYHLSDSVVFLTTPPKDIEKEGIGLLYLDSFDYPYDELMMIYHDDQQRAHALLLNMPEELIQKFHHSIFDACQEHCLAEAKAAAPWLSPGSVVLIDDNGYPGGGKSRLAKLWLADNGWVCLLDAYQTVWTRS